MVILARRTIGIDTTRTTDEDGTMSAYLHISGKKRASPGRGRSWRWAPRVRAGQAGTGGGRLPPSRLHLVGSLTAVSATDSGTRNLPPPPEEPPSSTARGRVICWSTKGQRGGYAIGCSTVS